MLVFSSAFADFGSLSTNSVDAAGFSKLSESEKAAIIKHVAEKAQLIESKEQQESSVQGSVDKWVTIGSKIGQGLAGAAKELNIAVNDFAQTPVGQLTTMLIVWAVIGQQLTHIFGGILIWIIGLSFVRFFFNRANPSEIVYDAEKRDYLGRSVVAKVKTIDVDGGTTALFMIATGAVILTGLATIFGGF